MEEIEIVSWSEFGEALNRIHQLRGSIEKRHGGRPLDKAIFRGVGNSRWGLETTLERSFPMERSAPVVTLSGYYRKITTSQPAVETMTGKEWEDLPDWPTFQRMLNERAEEWIDCLLGQNAAIYRYLVYLRHHSFPSPLLDWTASPYVAALFAFDAMDKDAEHLALYAYLQDTIHASSADEHFFVVGPYIRTHPRHYLQQSRYSLCVSLRVEGSGEDRRVDYLFCPHEQVLTRDRQSNTDLMVKLKIPADQRRAALEQLDSMNINPFSLFGSEESLIRTVARRECLFKEWQL